MNKWLRIALIVILVVLVLATGGILFFTRSIAWDMVYHPADKRPELVETPADYGAYFEEVSTTTEDGVKLYGWFLPGENGATVIVSHGSPGGRQDGLYEAGILNQAGFSVLMGSFRAHDESEGEIISYGYKEQQDLAAWHLYLMGRSDIDASRIGLFGESMGGGTGILFTADQPTIRAIATASGFAITPTVVEKFILYENPDMNPLVVKILARLIVFWAERLGDFRVKDLDTVGAVGKISPRPILIIHGGNDDKIGSEPGELLFAAAKEPKDFIIYKDAGHVDFEKHEPDEYSRALISFFEQNLLGG
jgi:fermentation-respiration switch protein FrsA (DUF1100 family)